VIIDPVRILIFLARGFEDLEAVSVLDVFSWTRYGDRQPGAIVTTTGFHDSIRSHCGWCITPDLPFEEINPTEYRAMVLPGGFHSQGFDEAYDERVYRLAREIHQNGGYLASMCVGSVPFAEAGLLKGKKATTYPFSRNHDNVGRLQAMGACVVDDPVVIDGRIISCRGPGASLTVAFLLMECLLGIEVVRRVKHFMISP
jgi:4-methyl-5(b-hydroxyethyl)-thiazole monophosphate biosynthesis